MIAPIKKLFQEPAGYLVKISLFRFGLMNDRFSTWFMEPLARAVENLWKRLQGIPNVHAAIDAARMEKSAAFLSQFAEERTTRASDGTEVRWKLYRPEKFNQWIAAHGGFRFGEWILPRTSQDWQRLKQLEEFRFFEKRGQAFRVPALVPGAGQSCVLRCQGFGRLMPMDKNFIGMHLAAGFNYALFDWRKDVSINGFLEDADACYQALRREGFAGNQVRIMASCRGTFPAVQLLERRQAEGIDAVLIQPPPSLEGVIANQMFPANQIALMGLGAIEKNGEHYDSVRRLRGMQAGASRLCVLASEGDKTLPPDMVEQFRQAYRRAGPFYTIMEPNDPSGVDQHFAEPLRKPDLFRRYAEFLAGRIP